jgi:hypothetical protein
MKPLYRSAVTLTFLTIVGIVISILFVAMKRMHIESWFFNNPSIVIGFLSGFLLVCIISLGNIHHLRRMQAKGILSGLDGFSEAAASIRALLPDQAADSSAPATPSQAHPEWMRALALLDERAGGLQRGERLSPLKGTTIQRWKYLCTPLARVEYAFYEVFTPVAESASAAYRTQSILPYLTDETERAATQEEFTRSLNTLVSALRPESAFVARMREYRESVDHFLGARRTAPKDAQRKA